MKSPHKAAPFVSGVLLLNLVVILSLSAACLNDAGAQRRNQPPPIPQPGKAGEKHRSHVLSWYSQGYKQFYAIDLLLCNLILYVLMSFISPHCVFFF